MLSVPARVMIDPPSDRLRTPSVTKLVASALAAVIAGLEAGRRPPLPAGGNLYGSGTPLPESLGVALELATRDDAIAEILGAASVHDFAAIARSEWTEYSKQVSDWERRRYLATS